MQAIGPGFSARNRAAPANVPGNDSPEIHLVPAAQRQRHGICSRAGGHQETYEAPIMRNSTTESGILQLSCKRKTTRFTKDHALCALSQLPLPRLPCVCPGFPLIHDPQSPISREVVANYSLLYRFPGWMESHAHVFVACVVLCCALCVCVCADVGTGTQTDMDTQTQSNRHTDAPHTPFLLAWRACRE